MATSYSGSIDWNEIYRTHYSISTIHEKVEGFLRRSVDILFCGFGEVAARLSGRHSVHFVEYSRSIVEDAKREFPEIHRISHADAIDVVAADPASAVLVLCRISAYWHSPDCLSRFFENVSCRRREVVAVDFFDAGRLEGGTALGSPIYSDVRPGPSIGGSGSATAIQPSLVLAQVQGSYQVHDTTASYSETRALYDSAYARALATKYLADYDISVELPVIASDPGFTIVARRKD